MVTESTRAGEFILSEGNGNISRDSVVIVSGETLAAGTLLGKITASGKFAAYDGAAADGTETAVGVLYADVDASAADKNGVMISRLAELKATLLVGDDANGLTDLAALHIIAR